MKKVKNWIYHRCNQKCKP